MLVFGLFLQFLRSQPVGWDVPSQRKWLIGTIEVALFDNLVKEIQNRKSYEKNESKN